MLSTDCCHVEAPSRKRDAGDFWNVYGSNRAVAKPAACLVRSCAKHEGGSSYNSTAAAKGLQEHAHTSNTKLSQKSRREIGEHQGELCSLPRTEPPTLHDQSAEREKHSSLQSEIRPSVASSHVCYNPKLFALCVTLVLIIYSSALFDGPSAFQAEAFKPFLCWRHTERSKCFPWDLEI